MFSEINVLCAMDHCDPKVRSCYLVYLFFKFPNGGSVNFAFIFWCGRPNCRCIFTLAQTVIFDLLALLLDLSAIWRSFASIAPLTFVMSSTNAENEIYRLFRRLLKSNTQITNCRIQGVPHLHKNH